MSTQANTKTNYTLKIDSDTRDAFSLLCDNIGISMSAAIHALMKQAIREQGMSFSLRDENGFTAAEAAELRRRISDVELGKLKEHALIEV